jgi:hypothetical protein
VARTLLSQAMTRRDQQLEWPVPHMTDLEEHARRLSHQTEGDDASLPSATL